MPYLTGDSLVGAPTACRRILIPDEPAFRRAVYGALLELCAPYNWEIEGTGTPDDYAYAAFEMVSDFLDSEGCGFTMPIGSIFPFVGDLDPLPAGLLLCDGTQYTQAQYPDLYDAIDAVYKNVGNQTFVVPDLRGRTPVGAGQGSGLTNRLIGAVGGAEEHILSTSEMPNHKHNQSVFLSTGTTKVPAQGNAATVQTASTTEATGGGQAHQNMQPFHVLPFVIVAE
jgi:microcystin-dependent protein